MMRQIRTLGHSPATTAKKVNEIFCQVFHLQRLQLLEAFKQMNRAQLGRIGKFLLTCNLVKSDFKKKKSK